MKLLKRFVLFFIRFAASEITLRSNFQIPIFLSKTLAENMFILQYPNRRVTQGPEEQSVVKSCVKPDNQEIKVDFGLTTKSVHYDAFKGEQLAIACDGKVMYKLSVLRQ